MSVRYHLPLLVGAAGAQTIAPACVASGEAVRAATVQPAEPAAPVSGRDTSRVAGRAAFAIGARRAFAVAGRSAR